jgi:heme exporter protein D
MMEAMILYFQMDGYAGFVWPAYGVTALVMGGLLLSSWRGLKACERELNDLQALSPRRRDRTGNA